MGTLSDAAIEELRRLTVRSYVHLAYGPTWEPGEYAFVIAKVTNTTSSRLTNVLITIRLEPWPVQGLLPVELVSGSWDGNGATVSSLAPGESVDLIVGFLRAVRTGWFLWRARVSAEMAAVGSNDTGYQGASQVVA